MNIAVLSGKGGTGKTTVSTNLALAMGVSYIDCDVEEPNGFIFLNPDIVEQREVLVEVPKIDYNLCTLCGRCAKVCEFHAMAKVGKEIVIFPKLCHDCGACGLVCDRGALFYESRSIGKIQEGSSQGIGCKRGILHIGEPMAVPVIRQVLEDIEEQDHIIDCPPGTSCNVVNTLKATNGAILVTEPSAFGLHDLKLAVELVKLYAIPFGVIVNKEGNQQNMVRTFCQENQIPLLGAIPYSQEAATLYSKGQMLWEDPLHKEILEKIAQKVKEVFSWNWLC